MRNNNNNKVLKVYMVQGTSYLSVLNDKKEKERFYSFTHCTEEFEDYDNMP